MKRLIFVSIFLLLPLVCSIFVNGFYHAQLANHRYAEAATNVSSDTGSSLLTQADQSSDNGNASIVLLSQKLKKGAGHYNHIVGEVKNVGNNTATSVKIGLTTYDQNGGVLGTDTTFVELV